MIEKIEAVRKNIEENKSEQTVQIVCATKMVDVATINSLPAFGLTTVGENKVQELLSKYDRVKGVKWRFIGNLQTNKVKYIIDKVEMIESVGSFALADEIDKQAKKRSVVMNVLVEINVGGEDSKGGIDKSKYKELLDYVSKKENLKLCGIMTVLPKNASDSLYRETKAIYDENKEEYGFTVLSMGMSDDYIKAVKYGSNEVRIGKALFGERIYTKG